jgi:hypothetical protein
MNDQPTDARTNAGGDATGSVNPYYQNPQLPRSVSIRRSLVSQTAKLLAWLQKQVSIEWI